MALIIVKRLSTDTTEPNANLINLARAISRDGYEVRSGGICAWFSPQEPFVYGFNDPIHACPMTHPVRDFSMSMDTIVLIYDIYDRIPLADKALLSNSKMFYDDPALVGRFMRRNMESHLRISSMPAAHGMDDRTVLAPVKIVPELEIGPCAALGTVHMINGAAGVDTRGNRWCIEHAAPIISTITGTLEGLTPPSLVAQFLLDQMALGFSIDILSFPDELQFVFLIGRDFYISAQPVRPCDRAQYYGGRKRLRVTSRVLRDVFQSHQARNRPNPKAAFDEFMSEAR